MFTCDYLLSSEFYRERLSIKQRRDDKSWRSNYHYIREKLDEVETTDFEKQSNLEIRLTEAERMIREINNNEHIDPLLGTPGADWVHRDCIL